jgi:tight adherence protein B
MNQAQQIALVAFIGVMAVALGFLFLRLARKMSLHDQLRKRLGGGERGPVNLLKVDDKDAGELAKLVAQSGYDWTVAMFVSRTITAAVFGLAVGWIFGGFALGLLLGAAGLMIFPILARQGRARRLALCDQQMPQALEIVTLALRAGHPLPKSLQIAAGEAPQPIADELRRVCDEHDLGRPIGDVLINMAARLPESESVHTFMTAVLVLQQTGGNLIAVIDRIVENARARAQYRAKLRALTAEGRASARMLAIMPLAFGLLAATVDSSYTHTLLFTSSGNIVLALCVVLWALGILWTQRLVRTD